MDSSNFSSVKISCRTVVVNLSPGTFIERLLFAIISGPRGKTKVRLSYISLFKATYIVMVY